MAAAYLFDTISQFKEHVGGGANMSLSLSAIKPSMLVVYRKHLRLWLGDATWTALVDGWEAAAGDDTNVLTKLLPYVRTPLAMLTMYEYSKIGGIQFGDTGMHRMETEERKGAYKYQESEYREYMLRNGFEAIEEMLSFLEANEDDYSDWQDSTGYTRNKSLYINTVARFRDVYTYSLDRYTFETLRSLMLDVENFAIRPLLGDDQHDDLKDGIANKDASVNELALIHLIQKAVASFTIELAAVQNWVTIKDNSIVQTEKLEPQSIAKEGIAGGQSISALLQQKNILANRQLSYIKKFLAENIADYPLYKAYLDEQAEEAEAAESNAQEWSFEDERYSGAYNYSTGNRHQDEKPSGIKRL